MINGFHGMAAVAKEIDRPMGEMVSGGEVKFESRENVWKNVEPSHFPIFQGTKIKTEKGASMITLENNSQIEVGPNSLLSFDRNDQMRLTQGAIDFRFPSTAELSFKVGNLTVSKAKSLQASQNPSAVSTKSEGTIGSISVHPNGSITVKSIRGALSIVDQEHVVLAALSSKDTVTIPSASAKGSSQGMVAQVIVAQAGDTTTGGGAQTENWEFLGLSTWWWVGIIAGVAAVAAIVAVAAGGGGGGGGGGGVPIPICP
jgi:disulfide bond formation protein DsbB